MLRGQGADAERSQPEIGGDHGARRGHGADRQIAQNGNSARGGAGAGARRLPAVHGARGRAEGGEAQPVSRAGAAVCLRPRDHAAPQRLPRAHRASAGRDPVQRRILHPGDPAGARGGRGGSMVRAAAGDPRKYRSRSGGGARRGVLLVRALDGVGRAGAGRPAADVLRRSRRTARRQIPGGDAGAARRRRGRGGRNRSGGLAARGQPAGLLPAVQLADAHRGQARRCGGIRRGRCRAAPARAAARGDPLRQEGRGAADPGEAGRAADGDRHARIVVRIEDQRQSLAAAVRAAQGGRGDARRRKARRGGGERAGAGGIPGARGRGVFDDGEVGGHARGIAGETGADHGARPEFVAAFGDPATGRCVSRRGGRAQEEPGVRDPLAEPGGLLPAPRLRLSRRRFPHRAGAAHLFVRADLRKPGTGGDRLVDLLGTGGRRAEPQPADRYLPAALGAPVAARQQEAAAHQSGAAARDVAHRVEPRAAAHRHQDGARRSAHQARARWRLQRERTLVPVAARRAQAVLWADQPRGSAGDRDTVGGGAAESAGGGRSAGRDGAADRRPHARSARCNPRRRAGAPSGAAERPAAAFDLRRRGRGRDGARADLRRRAAFGAGAGRMSTAARLAWLLMVVVWVAGAFRNKRTVRGMARTDLIVHVLVLAAAFDLLLAPGLRRGALAYRLVPDSGWIEDVGGLLQIAGIAFAIWARLHIGRNWSGTVTLKEGHALVRSGPYAWVRHPIYSGLVLAAFGLALEHGELGGTLGFLLLTVEWKRKSMLEERLMIEQLGEEYKQYRRKVKGLVPGIW